jgi:leucyl/phenylalanyl-tRNA--protein transferase
MTIYLPELDSYSLAFPSPIEALKDPNGLLALGGDLREERLILAYRQGIFPWYSPEDPILWWSPSPRAVFIPSEFRPSKSLRKFYRKSRYKISINHCTSRVINLCGSLRDSDEMWLNSEMRHAYSKLAEMGRCHSVEVWEDNDLIGGLYGVNIGKVFCGESMFSIKSNASKIALWAFCEHFYRSGGQLIDCQVLNPHTESLGAHELTRACFLQKLHALRDEELDCQCFQPQWLTIPSLEKQ